MTEEAQDAVVGRLVREYKEQNELAVKLEAEARRIGGEIAGLGQALMITPSHVFLPGEGIPSTLSPAFPRFQADFSVLSADMIRKLLTDYKGAVAKREQCAKELARLGFKPE